MPKLTLQHIKGNSYYCNGILSIGVYVHEKMAVLIDSGSDENWAKDISKTIETAGYAT